MGQDRTRQAAALGVPVVPSQTCHSCRHSVGHAEGLWCQLWDCESLGDCHEYEYEPGTDAGER